MVMSRMTIRAQLKQPQRGPSPTQFCEVEVDLPAFREGADYQRFRAKAQAFLRAHQDEAVVRKLRMNEPLTSSDLAALERILIENGVGGDAEVQLAALAAARSHLSMQHIRLDLVVSRQATG